jgi:hypothetical protein
MRFWFRVYSPYRSLWRTYAAERKRRLIREHAASVFEDFCRARFTGAQRYWDRNVELDLVVPDPQDRKRLLVAELKWRHLSAAERKNVLRQLEGKWSHCLLRAKHPRVWLDVLDASVLAENWPRPPAERLSLRAAGSSGRGRRP